MGDRTLRVRRRPLITVRQDGVETTHASHREAMRKAMALKRSGTADVFLLDVGRKAMVKWVRDGSGVWQPTAGEGSRIEGAVWGSDDREVVAP